MKLIQLPADVQLICGTLDLSGFQAYPVGGCVRDGIMGETPNDWDIATNARPEQVLSLFPRVIETGIKHGTVTVVFNDPPSITHRMYEVTTFRTDGNYSDGRRPDSVEYSDSIEDDLKRRDFTINAMAYDPFEDKIIDPHGGMGDITNSRLRAVGEARERFNEDGLRLMRAARFAAKYCLMPDMMLKAAMYQCRSRIENVAFERIREEFFKLLSCKNPKLGMRMLIDAQLIEHVLGFDVIPQMLRIDALQHTPTDPIIRLASLLRGDPAGALHVAHRLKLSAAQASRLRRIVSIAEYIYQECDDVRIKEMVALYGMDALEDSAHLYPIWIPPIVNRARKMIENGEAISMKDLAVNGDDFKAAGIPPGPEYGRVLNTLLDMVRTFPEKNEKNILMEKARKLFNG